MNIVCLIIGIVFLIFVLVGLGQGMFRVILSVTGLIASIFISLYCSPYISGYLQENTKIDDKIAEYISHELQYSDTGEEMTKGIQVAAINGLPLPDPLKETILNNNNSEMYEALKVSGVYDYIAMFIAVVILNAAVFLALILICRVIFWFVGRHIGDLSKLPILRWIDKVGGGVLGGIRGLIWIWIFFLFLSITSTFSWSSMLIEEISESAILRLLYNHNIFVDVISDLTRVLFM